MKRTTLIGAALALFILSGCAQEPVRRWYKDGGTQESFSIDDGQCRAQAFGVPGVSLLQAALVYNGCMNGKGWVQR